MMLVDFHSYRAMHASPILFSRIPKRTKQMAEMFMIFKVSNTFNLNASYLTVRD